MKRNMTKYLLDCGIPTNVFMRTVACARCCLTAVQANYKLCGYYIASSQSSSNGRLATR